MPLPLLPLLATAAPGLWQGISGIIQGSKANKVRLQDTRPDSLKEEVAIRRQAANSALMPGQKAAESNIRQNAANSAAALAQAGTGSSGILAGLSRLNQNTNQATQQLATQAAGYQDQARNQLVGSLRQDAVYRTADQNAFNREKAALKQASAANLFGGLSTLGSVGAYGAMGGFTKDPITGVTPGLTAMNAQMNPAQPNNGGYGYDPNQSMMTGIGAWGKLHPATKGRWF